MLTITMEDSSIIRCMKYGYNLSDKKTWKTAANCKSYTAKVIDKTSQRARVYLSPR
jgi:hypothetical protein